MDQAGKSRIAMDYLDTLARFEKLVRNRSKDQAMAALIIDSPWLPGYLGVSTLDFYFDPKVWMDAHDKALEDLPGVAFVPGTWVELGMAAEPSGFGVPTQWSNASPPSVRPYPGGLSLLVEAETPDPEKDGLMPAILRQYERMKAPLTEKGMAPRMAAARGPLAVASHLTGVTELLMATQLEPEKCLALVEKTTDLCILWLRAQLERMDEPIGVLVLDDIVGMIGPEDAAKYALPQLERIFSSFPGLIHIYHNDTPNQKMLDGLATIGMDVFNFSHEVDVKTAREKLGDVVLMGNIPPLEILVRGSVEQVRKATEALLQKASEFGPILISPGGGVSPETPIDNLQAMAEVVRAG
jgi:uroporphyrinogen decarboxylase